MGVDHMSDGLERGDVVINEVMWYGAHGSDPDGYDEFVELRNMTDRDIRLDLWQIANANDFVVGLPPACSCQPTACSPSSTTWSPTATGSPKTRMPRGGDMVVNSFNDDRQARLALKDGALGLRLLDPDGTEMDVEATAVPPTPGLSPTAPSCPWSVRTSQARETTPPTGTRAASKSAAATSPRSSVRS